MMHGKDGCKRGARAAQMSHVVVHCSVPLIGVRSHSSRLPGYPVLSSWGGVRGEEYKGAIGEKADFFLWEF